MNQDTLPESTVKQPDGPFMGPHLILTPEELDSKKREMRIGEFLTDHEVEGLHQLQRHREAVRDNGWNPAEGSNYTEADHLADTMDITAAAAAIRDQGAARLENSQNGPVSSNPAR